MIEESSDVAFEEIPNLNDQSRDVGEIQFELRRLSLNDRNIERVKVDSDDDEQRQQRTQSDPLPDIESLPVPSETIHEAPPTPRQSRITTSHPQDQIVGDIQQGVRTRSFFRNESNEVALISEIEPKLVDEALRDPDWIIAMQDELGQFERSQVWDLVPRPKKTTIIGTKWVFKNKLNQKGEVVRNKARLVAKGYSQVEGSIMMTLILPWPD